MIEYRLIRSNRRTLSISIDEEGALIAHAPARMPRREIEAFILQKEGWIARKQALVQARARCAQSASLTDGAQTPFWGETLVIRLESRPDAFEENGTLHLPEGDAALPCALQWRRERAQQLITPRVAAWAKAAGLYPESIAYGNAQKRWGSMSARRSLRLNAALVHVPPALCDYVIVHELCHIAHPDHSPAFHAMVRSVLPEADRLRSALREWAYVLSIWR